MNQTPTAEELYQQYSLSDNDIEQLIFNHHPIVYIPFVEKYITAELYNANQPQVANWLELISDKAAPLDNITDDELAVFYKHAINISNFEFPAHKIPSYVISHLFKKEDTTQYKQQLIEYLKLATFEILEGCLGWPYDNILNLLPTDAVIIKNYHAKLINTLVIEELASTAMYEGNKELNYFCDSDRIIDTLLKVYKDSPLELLEIKQNSMPLLAHALINECDHQILYQMGRELYGDRFKTIYNTGQSLGLLGKSDFWKANLAQMSSYELPELLLNHDNSIS